MVEAKDGDEGEGRDIKTSEEAGDRWRKGRRRSIINVWTGEFMLQLLAKLVNMRRAFEVPLSGDCVCVSVETDLTKYLKSTGI